MHARTHGLYMLTGPALQTARASAGPALHAPGAPSCARVVVGSLRAASAHENRQTCLDPIARRRHHSPRRAAGVAPEVCGAAVYLYTLTT